MGIITNKTLIFLFSIIATITVTQAQVNGLGRCPNVQTALNFSVDGLSEKWYEHSRYPVPSEFFGKCTTVTFTPQPDGTIHVHNSDVSPILGNEQSLNGTAEVIDDGKLYVTYINRAGRVGEDYWILGTDYNEYAVAYSCEEGFLNLSHRVKVWILTRERHPDDETIAAAQNVLTEQNLSLTPLRETDQTGCAN